MTCPLPSVEQSSIWYETGKNIIAPFVGAGLAFLANAWNERRKRKRDNLAAGNLALSILERQLNVFFNVRKGFLDDRAQRIEQMGQGIPKWLNFKPMMFTFVEDLKFDFQPLTFLFEQGDTDVIQKLAIAEGRYLDLAAVTQICNETLETLQHQMVEMGIGKETEFAAKDVEAKLGPALIGKANSFTDALIKRFDEDEKDYKAATVSLRKALLKSYRSEEVVRLTPIEGFNRLDWTDI